jgi:chloramphenicol O-acetyltransferase type A
MGHPLDLKTWKRRQHFNLFRAYEQPYFSVCVDVDASAVWRRSHRAGGPPFFLTSLFAMLTAVNATEAFRLRIRKRGLWLHDRVAVGPTLLKPDHTFAFARLEASDSLEQFLAYGGKAIAAASRRQALEPRQGKDDDIVYQSSLPWIRFTSFTNAIGSRDSIPRIVFGKCVSSGRRHLLPVSVEVHHAVVDGLDVARFLERFQHELAEVRL